LSRNQYFLRFLKRLANHTLKLHRKVRLESEEGPVLQRLKECLVSVQEATTLMKKIRTGGKEVPESQL
jgi:hypothetical protein